VTTCLRVAAFSIALLIGSATGHGTADHHLSGTVVELETPLASSQPLQGYLRQPAGASVSPAVVLLHSCNGNWLRLDERWGKLIASWGYVTLAVDSFGPRGLENTCAGSGPTDLAFDGYRALKFLVQRPFVDADRVAVVGFSQGGWIALNSVERGAVEQSSPSKFRAAVAFYPRCLGVNGNMTVPTLVLVGELDDWTPAGDCRNLVEGRDDWGISRQKDEGVPIRLVVYPGAYHAFDTPNLKTPRRLLGHRLEFNQSAADQSVDALREFLYATIGGKGQNK
jgi:dienelactone hydrolase